MKWATFWKKKINLNEKVENSNMPQTIINF